jgi:hypothetical protein
MSTARVFTPENRLAKILESLNGPTAGELVADAEKRIDELHDAIREYVREKLATISAYAEQGEDVLFAECRALADASLEVAEVAGAAGLEAVGEVARGISAMVDSLATSGVWHSDALKLHLSALTLVTQEGGHMSKENAVILDRLRGMRAAVGVAE